jgi:hypothetical protein
MSGFVFRIEDVDQAQEIVLRQARTALEAERILDATAELDMRAVQLPRAVADPEEVRRRVVPVATRGIDSRHRLLVAEQQRLVAGVEIRGAQLRHELRRDAAGFHEGERFADVVGDLAVALAGRRAGDEAEIPAVDVVQIGVAASRESAQQVERGR